MHGIVKNIPGPFAPPKKVYDLSVFVYNIQMWPQKSKSVCMGDWSTATTLQQLSDVTYSTIL